MYVQGERTGFRMCILDNINACLDVFMFIDFREGGR